METTRREHAIRRRISQLLCAALLAPFAAAALADGKALFATCQACHGADGSGNRDVGAPNIAGMDAWYIERQLNNFDAGRRGTASGDNYGVQMRAIVATLPTAADRSAVAAYVASLPRATANTRQAGARKDKAAAAASPDLTNGRNFFNAACSACHAASGLGNPPLNAPRLAGIDPVYLARQLSAFRGGLRGYHADDKPGRQMRAALGMLPEAKAERDVIGYIASLKP